MEKKKAMLIILFLAAMLLLSGCLPAAPPGPAAPFPPGLILSCLTPLAVLTLLVLLIAGLFFVAEHHSTDGKTEKGEEETAPRASGGAGTSAKEIARRRYAAGEITYDELQEILRHLDESERRSA